MPDHYNLEATGRPSQSGDAATAKQSAWGESSAYLAIITMGQQNNQASLSEPLGLSTGQELVKHHLQHQTNELCDGGVLALSCAISCNQDQLQASHRLASSDFLVL